jgi:hypothetical protein
VRDGTHGAQPYYVLLLALPNTYLDVDEAMIAYRGRSIDKVKLSNKSIKEAYKVWVSGDAG